MSSGKPDLLLYFLNATMIVVIAFLNQMVEVGERVFKQPGLAKICNLLCCFLLMILLLLVVPKSSNLNIHFTFDACPHVKK